MNRMMVVKVSVTVLYASLCFGFQVYPGGNKWSVTKEDPTIWVKFCTTDSFGTNDLPDGDSGASLATTDFAGINGTIFSDYNNISGSFIRLAAYPADPSNPGAPATGDSTFTLTKAETRTIEVCFGSTAGGSAGYAKQKWSGVNVEGCTITLGESSTDSTKEYVRLLTHEIGHCLGLNHVHESTTAIMSYFSTEHRLQNDDKSGLVYSYPNEASYGVEGNTMGFACAAQ